MGQTHPADPLAEVASKVLGRQHAISAAELARRTGIPKGRIYRILRSLAQGKASDVPHSAVVAIARELDLLGVLFGTMGLKVPVRGIVFPDPMRILDPPPLPTASFVGLQPEWVGKSVDVYEVWEERKDWVTYAYVLRGKVIEHRGQKHVVEVGEDLYAMARFPLPEGARAVGAVVGEYRVLLGPRATLPV